VSGVLRKNDITRGTDFIQYRASFFVCAAVHRGNEDKIMAIFRVEKTTGYTVMSNHHLRNAELSLKAKGLLSQMLSLPEGWDYTLQGLSYINREKIDAIREAVRELERAGYITRSRIRNGKGQLTSTEYVIREQPQSVEPISENPTLDKPTLENPTLENPTLGKPTLGNPTQINKDISSKEIQNKDLSNIESNQSSATARVSMRRSNVGTSAIEAYREVVHDNIDYEIIAGQYNRERLDEIVELIVETLCSARTIIRVAGDDYPAELVKAKLLKLNSTHIDYIFECLDNNATEIRNIKKYLLTVLFNAPGTIDSYYTAKVKRDMEGEGLL